MVIGNPPYISIQDLKKIDIAVTHYYSTHYLTAGRGNFDIYLPFVEKAFSILSERGFVDFIMPTLWLYNEYGREFRKLLTSNGYLNRLLDFGSTQVFEDATVYTACQMFSKKWNESFSYTKVNAKNFDTQKLQSSNILIHSLNDEIWSLADKESLALKSKLDLISKPLGELCDIFVGVQTSADIVYHLKKIGERTFFSKRLNKIVELEEDLLKPLISGSEAKKYVKPYTEKFLLHPYRTYKPFSLIDEDDLKLNYRRTFEYLKLNESFLRARENGKMDHDRWYAYNYPKNLNRQTLPKIGIAQTVANLQCFLDLKGEFFLNNVRVNGITPKDEKLEIKFLLGLLNSRLLNFYFKLIGKPKDNGFYEANKQFIFSLPIIVPSLANQKLIINIVDHIHEIRQYDPKAEISTLESQIDQMVYKLYDLTEEEIAIIENPNKS